MAISTLNRSRIVVIGGGILGLAVARQLVADRPRSEIMVIEKEPHVAAHQTGHNSGVVHAGLYYEPGSLKARLCRRGIGLLRAFAHEHGVHYHEVGKLVIAHDEEENRRLESIAERATANGVEDLEMLEASRIADIEPYAVGLRALHSPHTAVVDYVGICRALAGEITGAGAELLLGTGVERVEEAPGGAVAARVHLRGGCSVDADQVISCAGLQSDRLAAASGSGRWPRIVPFSGDYLVLREHRSHLVRGLIYPVPDPRYPFLGVHLTRMHDGRVLVGPNAFLAAAREGYARNSFNIRDAVGIASEPGFWRFAASNVPAALREIATATSRARFVEGASRFVPELTADDVLPGPRGVRAQAMGRDGALLDDFAFSGSSKVLHVRNAPSPGATSALAIAEEVVQRAG